MMSTRAYCEPVRPKDWQRSEEESWSEVVDDEKTRQFVEKVSAILADLGDRERYDVDNIQKLQSERLREEFTTLADQWLRETKHYSLVSKKVCHDSYFRIMGMGKPAIPLLLEALRDRPSFWFAALKATTGVDVSKDSENPAEARAAWLEWGREHGYID